MLSSGDTFDGTDGAQLFEEAKTINATSLFETLTGTSKQEPTGQMSNQWKDIIAIVAAFDTH